MYSDILEINKNFQTSVNIDYDLGNSTKIREYIPTSDVCDVLKIYFRTLLKKEKSNATILVGPYGKGKSFLILTLLQLICFKKDENSEILLEKINEVDKELFELIDEFDKKKRKYLPVIIDSNYYNIEQSFLLSLNESLKSEKLFDIVPQTVYDVCLDLISRWENDASTYKKVLLECANKYGVTLNEIKHKLQSFDYEGYKQFENIYNCVTTGLQFNPLMNTDVVKTFSDVNNQLYKKGYEGIFIVYDEFNKTLEAKNDYLSKDLKLIQDFAEKANRSGGEEQMHLCCVTHKSLALYQEKKNSSLLDSFKTVEGRFKEIRFNRSLDQNYQIISLSINRKDGFLSTYDTFAGNNKWFFEQLKRIDSFDEMDLTRLCEKCFPFNPISVLALIQLSELVAQNERTMFTLISDTDENSFSSFAINNDEGLYNVDRLYDYFYKSFAADEGDIKSIWYKCESSLSQVRKQTHKKILKALACIRMINDFAKLPPTVQTISLALFAKEDEILREIDELTEKKILKKSFDSTNVDFSFSNIKEIDSAVETFILQKKSHKKDSEILQQIDENKYYLPRKYNAQHKITRYFRSRYIDENELFSINSFDMYFEEAFCDGIVMNVINPTKTVEEYKKAFEKIENNERVILRVSHIQEGKIIDEAKVIDALMFIENNNQFDDNTKAQVSLLLREKKHDMVSILNDMFADDGSNIICSHDVSTLAEAMHSICEEQFNACPVVNIEMVNRENVLTSYKKARDTIVNCILKHANPLEAYSATSPEVTVFNSFFNGYNNAAEQTNAITRVIKDYFKSISDTKKNLEGIVAILRKAPYGIRKGLLPIYFALAIANMDDNTILYYENTEIEINAANIEKFCQNPGKYKLLIEEMQAQQEKYLFEVCATLGGNAADSFYSNLHTASFLLRKWFINLPTILREINENDNYLDLDTQFYKMRKLFLQPRVNDYETLVNKLPEIFDGSFELISSYVNNRDSKLETVNQYLSSLADQIKGCFISGYSGSLKSCISDWVESKNVDLKDLILDGTDNAILKGINNIGYNDGEAANLLASAIIGYRIEDWTVNNTERILKAISSFTDSALKSSTSNADDEILNLRVKTVEKTPMGVMFENNIESTIDEFSGSVSNEEKAFVLMQMIKKLKG